MSRTKYKSAEQKPPSSRFKGALEIATVLIALWGGSLSTWVFIRQSAAEQPRVCVRLDVNATGFDQNSRKFVGDVVVYFSNVGTSTISIQPHIGILAVDARTGNAAETSATLEPGEKSKIKERPGLGVGPITLKPGDEAIAKTDLLELNKLVNPLDYYAARFELSDQSKYLAFFSEPEYVKRDKNSGELIGWSSGSMAHKL